MGSGLCPEWWQGGPLLLFSIKTTSTLIDDSLFWIVSRVSEYPQVYSPEDAIKAFYNNAVLVSVNKFVIE